MTLHSRPWLLLSAKAAALLFGISVLGYVVYCAQTEAKRPAPTLMPSSKNGTPTPIERSGPSPVQNRTTVPPAKETSKKEADRPVKKPVYMDTSKSGVPRLLKRPQKQTQDQEPNANREQNPQRQY